MTKRGSTKSADDIRDPGSPASFLLCSVKSKVRLSCTPRLHLLFVASSRFVAEADQGREKRNDSQLEGTVEVVTKSRFDNVPIDPMWAVLGSDLITIRTTMEPGRKTRARYPFSSATF